MERQGWEQMLYDELDRIGIEITNQMKEIVVKNKAVASGKLLNSITHKIIVQNGVFDMVIEYADYGYFVNSGRRPSQLGKFPPMQDIKNWMALKGIPQQALWPIMMKIKNGGFYSKKVGMVRGVVDGKQRQRTIYSKPMGINFTSPFEKNLDLQKILKGFADIVKAEIPKDLLEGLGFEKK